MDDDILQVGIEVSVAQGSGEAHEPVAVPSSDRRPGVESDSYVPLWGGLCPPHMVVQISHRTRRYRSFVMGSDLHDHMVAALFTGVRGIGILRTSPFGIS